MENDYFSGVYVSADIDTVLYTMSNQINDELWHGIKGDTFITNEQLEKIGAPELLRIGDKDRATKIQKTELMKKYSLSESVDIQAKKMGISSKIMPMSNEDSEIKIVTDIGELEFHDFLIKHQCQPEVLDVKFSNVSPSEGIIETINNSKAVIIGHSNPITSILPILSLEGVRDALKKTYVIAVSPIIGEDSVSGPASKFMKALNIEVSPLGVASLYEDFLDNIDGAARGGAGVASTSHENINLNIKKSLVDFNKVRLYIIIIAVKMLEDLKKEQFLYNR